MPGYRGPAFDRITIDYPVSLSDINANTLATLMQVTEGFRYEVERLRLIVSGANWTGAGGTLTFEVHKNTQGGPLVAQLVVVLANCTVGTAPQEAVVSAANQNNQSNLFNDADILFLVRAAAGTVFTAGTGLLQIVARQRPQAKI